MSSDDDEHIAIPRASTKRALSPKSKSNGNKKTPKRQKKDADSEPEEEEEEQQEEVEEEEEEEEEDDPIEDCSDEDDSKTKKKPKKRADTKKKTALRKALDKLGSRAGKKSKDEADAAEAEKAEKKGRAKKQPTATVTRLMEMCGPPPRVAVDDDDDDEDAFDRNNSGDEDNGAMAVESSDDDDDDRRRRFKKPPPKPLKKPAPKTAPAKPPKTAAKPAKTKKRVGFAENNNEDEEETEDQSKWAAEADTDDGTPSSQTTSGSKAAEEIKETDFCLTSTSGVAYALKDTSAPNISNINTDDVKGAPLVSRVDIDVLHPGDVAAFDACKTALVGWPASSLVMCVNKEGLKSMCDTSAASKGRLSLKCPDSLLAKQTLADKKHQRDVWASVASFMCLAADTLALKPPVKRKDGTADNKKRYIGCLVIDLRQHQVPAFLFGPGRALTLLHTYPGSALQIEIPVQRTHSSALNAAANQRLEANRSVVQKAAGSAATSHDPAAVTVTTQLPYSLVRHVLPKNTTMHLVSGPEGPSPGYLFVATELTDGNIKNFGSSWTIVESYSAFVARLAAPPVSDADAEMHAAPVVEHKTPVAAQPKKPRASIWTEETTEQEAPPPATSVPTPRVTGVPLAAAAPAEPATPAPPAAPADSAMPAAAAASVTSTPYTDEQKTKNRSRLRKLSGDKDDDGDADVQEVAKPAPKASPKPPVFERIGFEPSESDYDEIPDAPPMSSKRVPAKEQEPVPTPPAVVVSKEEKATPKKVQRDFQRDLDTPTIELTVESDMVLAPRKVKDTGAKKTNFQVLTKWFTTRDKVKPDALLSASGFTKARTISSASDGSSQNGIISKDASGWFYYSINSKGLQIFPGELDVVKRTDGWDRLLQKFHLVEGKDVLLVVSLDKQLVKADTGAIVVVE